MPGGRGRDESELLSQALRRLWELYRDHGYLSWPDDPAEEPEVCFLALGAADRRTLPTLLARVALDSPISDARRTTTVTGRYAARWFRCLWRRGVRRAAPGAGAPTALSE